MLDPSNLAVLPFIGLLFGEDDTGYIDHGIPTHTDRLTADGLDAFVEKMHENTVIREVELNGDHVVLTGEVLPVDVRRVINDGYVEVVSIDTDAETPGLLTIELEVR